MAVHTYYPLGDAKRWTRDMTALASMARRSGPDAVFLGDFNASLDHTPMRGLLEAGRTDTHAELGHGWARTWPVDHALVPPDPTGPRPARPRPGGGSPSASAPCRVRTIGRSLRYWRCYRRRARPPDRGQVWRGTCVRSIPQ
ncbi:endonuclease/exonuclease/phosphatase family protein [Streptomyces sp. NPDC056192]|uniref:endonuclease/exonuclease/phosphatase family protein n=1 Tax=Streptomyces sp. NPDC056192 TaxID=3345743 RepID=UPI0035DC1228